MSSKFNKLFFFQPFMTKYRETFFHDMNKKCFGNFEIICGKTPDSFQSSSDYPFSVFKCETLNIVKFVYFNGFPFKAMFCKRNAIIHFADFKYLSLYCCLFIKLLSGARLYLHGQGGYKKNSRIQSLVYTLFILFTNGYICYNKYCADQLKKKVPAFLHKKIHHVDNTLYLETVPDVNRSYSNKIAFIGRLRPRSGLEELLEAVCLVRKEIPDVTVEIVGSGPDDYVSELRNKYDFARFHGAIYSENEIQDALADCAVGAYGGDAGLSVVHYMALGLPVVVHSKIESHMGPEPAYVIDNHNGLLFERSNINDLSNKMLMVLRDGSLRNSLAKNALDTFGKLSRPSMAEKFLDIIK